LALAPLSARFHLRQDGRPADVGGYYRPDAEKASAVMRPSATFNEALASLG